MSGDAFDILGLPAVFDVDGAALQRAYLAKSREVHPDRAGPVEGGDGADPAARLNEARRMLADPEQRAEALLARRGGAGKSADRSLPAGFLAEMMGVREQIEESLASGSETERARWQEWADQRRAGHIAAVSRLFAEHDRTRDAAVLAQIRKELNVWRYAERLIEQLDADPS